MNLEKYQQYSRIARGLEKADLVLKDARIVNVFTEEIIRGDIAIQLSLIHIYLPALFLNCEYESRNLQEFLRLHVQWDYHI